MSTTVCVSGTVQFTFFLVMKLNINIVTSCDWLTVILIPVLWFHCVVDITTAQLHSTKPELSAGQVQSPPAVCQRFEIVRISENGPDWK